MLYYCKVHSIKPHTPIVLQVLNYHIAQNFDGGNFDGGNFDVFDAFQLDRQYLTRQIV